MLYILCLESEGKEVTKEQLFIATLKKLMKETFSRRALSIIAPTDIKKAKFQELVKLDAHLPKEELFEYIDNFFRGNTSKATLIKDHIEDVIYETFKTVDLPDRINTNSLDDAVTLISDTLETNFIDNRITRRDAMLLWYLVEEFYDNTIK